MRPKRVVCGQLNTYTEETMKIIDFVLKSLGCLVVGAFIGLMLVINYTLGPVFIFIFKQSDDHESF